MMPALKIHSNREYIDSYVIELSLSSLCHGSHGSLSGLMYYRKHAAPPVPSASVCLTRQPPLLHPSTPHLLHTAALGASPPLLAS